MSTFSGLGLITRKITTLALSKKGLNPTPTINFFHKLALAQPSSLLHRNDTILKSLPTARFQSRKANDTNRNTEENNENADWVKFQQSIQVKGFDTGQQTVFSARNTGQIGKKRRGGKRMRKIAEKQKELMAASENEPVQLGGGHFPAFSYSEEETARLLAEAYANLPTRTGKRGTKNLKRQKIRFMGIRKRAAQKKRERINAHFKKMEKRSQKVKDVKAVHEKATDIREKDKLYQNKIVENWILLLQKEQGNLDINVKHSESLVDSEDKSVMQEH